MSFLNMHFRLGNYEYMGGKYSQLVMKGSRHRGWDQTGITQTLQKYKTRFRTAHSHKNLDIHGIGISIKRPHYFYRYIASTSRP
jgi:hypothetical protein